MPVFSALEKEWLVNLDAPKCSRVREECQVELAVRPGSQFDLRAITEDPEKLPLVLWVLCREQAQSLGIDRDAFVVAIVGDAAERAGFALAEAIINFIPSRQRREAMRAALEQDREAERIGLEITTQRLPEVAKASRAKVAEAVHAAIDQTLARLSAATDSPASSESSPTDAPGAS